MTMPLLNARRCEAHLAFQKSESDYDSRIIVGVASTADVDRQGQIVDQQSLALATEMFMDTNRSLFWMHDWNAPIGEVLDMKPQKKKLIAKAKIGTDFEVPLRGNFGGMAMTHIDNIWQWIVQGIVRSYSIGFLGDQELDPKGKEAPRLKVSDLLELSVVTLPAARRTQFNVAKALMNPWSNDFDLFNAMSTDANAQMVLQALSADAILNALESEGLNREELYEFVEEDDDSEITESQILNALDAFTKEDDSNVIKIERAIETWKSKLQIRS